MSGKIQNADVKSLAELQGLGADKEQLTHTTKLYTPKSEDQLETVLRKNNFSAVVDPTVNDDIDLKYETGSLWFNTDSEELFICKDNTDGAAVWVGTGGAGGGGSFAWEENGESSPLSEIENGISLYSFDKESQNELYALILVPTGYKEGKQIALEGLKYYAGIASGNVFFKTETQLIKTNQDMTALPLTPEVSDNVEKVQTVANRLEAVGVLKLTDGDGEVNAVAVAGGDLLVVRLFRDNLSETAPANADAKMLKFSTTINFDYKV